MPDMPVTARPGEVRPFIMNPEGISRLFSRGMMRDGPFAAHMEPFEAPIANVFNPKMRGNPVARVFESTADRFAEIGAPEFPFVATSYRLTEHFHYRTKHNPVNAALQPEFFVEISEELAAERGIERGGRVRVWSKRGEVWAKAVVTKRLRPMQVDGKTVHVIGIPLHWGFVGAARKGFGPNSLTPQVGDANVEPLEFKGLMVILNHQPRSRWHERNRAPTQDRGLEPSGSAHGVQPAAVRRGPHLGHAGRSAAGPATDQGRQADRRQQMHRLQGLPVRLHRVERH